MSDEPDDCVHVWGEAEFCETRLGNIASPVCRLCGAVKLVQEARPAPKKRFVGKPAAVVAEPAPAEEPVHTNTPPAGATVHAFQMEMFTDA